MRKLFLVLALVVTLEQFDEFARSAEAIHVMSGQQVFSADGHTLGAINRVLPNGAVVLIVDGRMVAISAEKLHQEHGAIVTSLTRVEVRDLK